MIKTTLKQVLAGMTGINALAEGKLPIKAKYAVAKLARACQSELEAFDKQREKLFEEAGCIKGEKMYTHPDGPEKVKEVAKQVDELLTAEVEINALPLDLEQFGDGEISGPAFFGLDWAMKAEG